MEEKGARVSLEHEIVCRGDGRAAQTPISALHANVFDAERTILFAT